MGNAIIATAVDGSPFALEHGKRGMLVPPGEPMRLAAAISKLLSDATLREKFAAAATEQLDEISVALMSARTVRVYEEALAYRGEPSLRGNDPPSAKDDPGQATRFTAAGIYE
jgi:glycosyltransferase involved in cell wall biosynthesis